MKIQLSTNEALTNVDPDFAVAVPWESPSYRAERLSSRNIVHARVRSLQGRTTSLWSTHVTGMAAVPPPTPPVSDVGSLSIHGLVVTGSGIDDYSRIPDALVRLTNLETMELEDLVLTNSRGFYDFASLSDERYRVDVAALGYQAAYPQYARSGAGYSEIQLDFWLTPEPAEAYFGAVRSREAA